MGSGPNTSTLCLRSLDGIMLQLGNKRMRQRTKRACPNTGYDRRRRGDIVYRVGVRVGVNRIEVKFRVKVRVRVSVRVSVSVRVGLVRV